MTTPAFTLSPEGKPLWEYLVCRYEDGIETFLCTIRAESDGDANAWAYTLYDDAHVYAYQREVADELFVRTRDFEWLASYLEDVAAARYTRNKRITQRWLDAFNLMNPFHDRNEQ